MPWFRMSLIAVVRRLRIRAFSLLWVVSFMTLLKYFRSGPLSLLWVVCFMRLLKYSLLLLWPGVTAPAALLTRPLALPSASLPFSVTLPFPLIGLPCHLCCLPYYNWQEEE